MKKSSQRTALFPFKRYWWVPIPVFLASMGGALSYLILTPDLYEAKVRLSVEDERTSVSDIGQTITETDELGGANPIVTQAEVITSQGILSDALRRYHKEAEVALVSEKLVVTEGHSPSVEDLMADLHVKIIPATNILEMSYRADSPRQSAAIVNAVAQAAVAQNVEDINLEAAAVRKFLDSRLPALETRLQRAELAESQYRQAQGLLAVEAQNRAMVNGVADLEQEARLLMAALEEAATRNQRLQEVTGIISPEEGMVIARVGQDPQLQALRSQITTTHMLLNEARSTLGDQHPELLALVDQSNGLQTLYAQRLAVLNPSGVGNVATLSAHELSHQLIAQSISNAIDQEALRNRLAVVSTELTQLYDQLAEQPSIQQPLAALSRERQEAADSLALIRQKVEEARLAEAQLVSNVRILGLAEPATEPISPSPFAVLALGGIAGGLLSLGAILLLDMLDASLQSGDEAEKLVKLPVLGYLPRLPADLVDIEGLDAFLDNARYVEPYRALLKTLESRQRARVRAASNGSTVEGASLPLSRGVSGRLPRDNRPPVQGLAQDVLPQVVVVSSPSEHEGKSSVTTCLGAVSAMLGRRTLIIEADPTNSIQHLYLRVEAAPGLTDVISQSHPLSEAIKLTTIGRLSVLPYGQVLNRPSTVTESAAMKVLLETLTRDYDLILVDATPVNMSADVITVSQMTDGLLLVTRPGYTPRRVLADTVQQLRKSGAPLLGIAMNETILPEEQLGRLPRQATGTTAIP